MHIFSKKREEQIPELSLRQVQERRRYDFFAALAKALLIFLLVYGALGGFLSAFEIEYNNGICMLLLFALALMLSVVYETGRRWLTNLTSVALFVLYLYIAVTNYWIINSGYYAVLNRFYEVAREYLDVLNGTEYTLIVEDSYMTVTAFAMFIGMVGVILLNIQLQNKCGLFKIILLTLTPYVIPLYFDCSPSLIYVLFLFIGYVAAAVLQGGNVRERLSGQMRCVLPVAAIVTVLLVRSTAFLWPEEIYERMIPASAQKKETEEHMKGFAQFGLMALLGQGGSRAGISGGRLSKGASAMPSYETDLIVRYTPYDFGAVYLKAFTGRNYTGSEWTEAADAWPEDGLMEGSLANRRNAYESGDSFQGRGIMEVERIGASEYYEYRPYYTDDSETVEKEGVTVYTYYPAGGQLDVMEERVDDVYLEVPYSCGDAVREICETAGFAGTSEEIAMQITEYFDRNYSYTLRPGFYYGNPDYISHFLLESKRGYCAHFASAGTMLFRNMGIPARYVEGYAFSYANVVENGILVEDAAYEDYYSGYSALGETGLVEMEISDASAHAWVEIYVEGKGWIVVDPTPSSTEQDTTSFWEAFRDIGGDGADLDFGENNLGTYLENVIGGVSYALVGAVVALVFVFAAGWLLRVRREQKLSGRERVQLEYSRIERYLSRRHTEYHTLRTLREQLDWVREHCGIEITREQEQALYQVYFGGNINVDCEKLCGELRRLRRIMRFSH